MLGGGGGGGVDAGSGGGGGGAYEATGVPVIPGAAVSTYVGAGGLAGIYAGTTASSGESSTVIVSGTIYRGLGGNVGPYGISSNPQPAVATGGSAVGIGGTATTGASGGAGKGWVSGQTGAGSVGNDGSLVTDISGTSTRYGGGGAGGANVNGTSVTIVNGGAGGGGAAGYNSPSNVVAADGAANTGGGGGAGMSNANPQNFKSSGAGGSGVIFIRYTPDTTAPTITNGGTPYQFAENTVTSTPAATIEISESSTISLASSGDYLKFSLTVVDSDTARIFFLASPDYEDPKDLNLDNDYVLSISLTDQAGNSGSSSITIRVTNVNEPAIMQAITYSGVVIKGVIKVLSVVISTPSRVRFFDNGKRIPTCLSQLTTGSYPTYLATCNWEPAVMSSRQLTAVATPLDSAIAQVISQPTFAQVLKRGTFR